MRIRTRSAAALAAGVLAAGGVTAAVVAAFPGDPTDLSSVPAQTKTLGISSPNVLSPGLDEVAVAQGSTKLENPAPAVRFYGYDSHIPGGSDTSAQAPFVPLAATSQQEAQKTEPDKNTYLTLARSERAPTRPTTTARTSSSRGTRPARPARSPGSTSTPTRPTA